MTNPLLFEERRGWRSVHLEAYEKMPEEVDQSPLVNFTLRNRSEIGVWMGRRRRKSVGKCCCSVA